MGLDNAQNRVSMSFPMPDVAANATLARMLWVAPAAFVITAIKFVDYGGVAQDATDHVTLAVKKGASTVIADWATVASTGDGALTAKTAATVPIETNQQNLAAGDALFFTKALAAAGKALTGFIVQIDGYYPN